ncbi:MAG: hypothetical protein KA521_01490 [Crocinitomicaceae bacterium]|nr:hypothetical protein [Crocinitomicaceae bacterium]
MKTFFLTILAAVSFGTLSYSQEMKSVVTQSKSELAAAKNSGIFVFKLPVSVSSEDVAKNASYYVNYFKVDYNKVKSEAKVTMVTNDATSRRIIMRFISSCGINSYIVDGVSLKIDEFYTTYLQ